MNKLKKYNNLGDIYETIGEERFGYVAYILTILMICAPLVAGVINMFMLRDSYSFITPYDAYNYNYKCMTLWNVIFSLMLMWIGVYILGKFKYNGKGMIGVLQAIRTGQRWLLWWLALLIWTVIPVACSVDPIGAIFGVAQLASGYISHIYMLGVMGCVYLISDERLKANVAWIFMIVTDVLSLVMLSFEYDIPFFRMFSAAPGVSVYTNSNHYGYIITMASLTIVSMYYICIYDETVERCKEKKIFCIVSLMLQSFAIVVNDTLGSYLAIVLVIVIIPFVWLYRTKRFSIEILLPIFILAFFTYLSYKGYIYTKLGSSIGSSLVEFVRDLFMVSHKSEGFEHAGTDRIGLWIETIRKIKQRPIVGYGPDIICERNGNYILWNTPHNEFLECAFFLGIPGLIMYLGGLVHLCVIKIKQIKNLSFFALLTAGVIIGYLASSFFGVRKFNTVCYFFMFIGLLISKTKKEE